MNLIQIETMVMADGTETDVIRDVALVRKLVEENRLLRELVGGLYGGNAELLPFDPSLN